jgi:O-acetylhomoserine/O-acetylserine sulfhydrylase-like pyridoxal-dependent enzyme
MIIRKTLFALVAAGLAFGSTAALAASAPINRAGSDIAASEDLRGSYSLLLLLLIAAGVVAIIVGDDDLDDLPTSP